MSTSHYIEDDSLSLAWWRLAQTMATRPGTRFGPVVVSVTGFAKSGQVSETTPIRERLDEFLVANAKQSIDTVANTIFPLSLWNIDAGRRQLFERYLKIQARTRALRQTYFGRMIDGGAKGRENQLAFIIDTFRSRSGVRASVLQVALFDPKKDHSRSARLGFPCLQHVSFAPINGALHINGFYATQYVAERAYGNYVGLCRLGRFIAHELELPLERMTCFTGLMFCDVNKVKLRSMLDKAAAATEGAD